MTSLTKAFSTGALTLLFGLCSPLAMAQAENFVDEASAKGMAEIQTAQMALEKSQSQDIKDFAQKMIDDHTKNRQELAKLTQDKKLQMSDEATLMDKAKSMILQLRDGESFDEAYANNQVTAHEQTIELYRQYTENGDNQDLKQFAQSSLPMLEGHLKHAQQLASKYGNSSQQQQQQNQQPSSQQQQQNQQQQNQQQQQQ